ncbi:MAG: aconitase family protein [Actinomycetota bacterium]
MPPRPGHREGPHGRRRRVRRGGRDHLAAPAHPALPHPLIRGAGPESSPRPPHGAAPSGPPTASAPAGRSPPPWTAAPSSTSPPSAPTCPASPTRAGALRGRPAPPRRRHRERRPGAGPRRLRRSGSARGRDRLPPPSGGPPGLRRGAGGGRPGGDAGGGRAPHRRPGGGGPGEPPGPRRPGHRPLGSGGHLRLATRSASEQRTGARAQFGAVPVLKPGQGASASLQGVSPATGNVHQVNLERPAAVVQDDGATLGPDTLVDTDSHTAMVNGPGVLGRGVGGIEAEAALVGRPISMLLPEDVGLDDGLQPRAPIRVTARRADGTTVEFAATARVDTLGEVEYLRHGGILAKVLRRPAAEPAG